MSCLHALLSWKPSYFSLMSRVYLMGLDLMEQIFLHRSLRFHHNPVGNDAKAFSCRLISTRTYTLYVTGIFPSINTLLIVMDMDMMPQILLVCPRT